MADKKLSEASAEELRQELLKKEWEEWCQARIERQIYRVDTITRKIEMKEVALDEAKAMLAAAKVDLKNGPPADWKGIPKPKPGGMTIEVPTGNVKTRGN